MGTESPPLDTRERQAASSPRAHSLLLPPSLFLSLSLAGSRFNSLIRVFGDSPQILKRRVLALAHGSAGTATRKHAATSAGSSQKLV